MIFRRARVSLSLLSLRKNGGLLVVYASREKSTQPTANNRSSMKPIIFVLKHRLTIEGGGGAGWGMDIFRNYTFKQGGLEALRTAHRIGLENNRWP